MVREYPVRRSNPMDPGTRSSGPPLVLISRGPEQTPIAPGKPRIRVKWEKLALSPSIRTRRMVKEFRDRDSLYTTDLDAAIEATGLLLKLAMSGSVPLL